MRKKNIIAGLFLTVLGLAYGYLTTGLPERSLPNTPGPSFFPWIITLCLLVLSASLTLQGLRMEPKMPETDKTGQHPSSAYIFLGLFVVYLVSLPFFGFLFASIPFFAALMFCYGEVGKLRTASISLGFPIFLFLLFRDVFNIPLPRGNLDILSSVVNVLT